MRLLVIRRTEFKPLGHVKASAGGIALKRRCILYQGRCTLFIYKQTNSRDVSGVEFAMWS